jgi:hypothetical protein
MANNFNPGFDREKAAFIALANRGEGLAPINYLYAKEASFESILSPVITGGTAELYTIYASNINSANITNSEDIITNRLKWSNPFNDYYVGFTAGNLTRNTIWRLPLQDGSDGQVIATNGNGILSFIDAGGGSAPKDATYILQQPTSDLPNAQALNQLNNGLMKNKDGVIQIAVPGEDYLSSTLPSGQLFIGNSSNIATAQQTIAIQNLPSLTDGRVWQGDSTNRPVEVQLNLAPTDATYIIKTPNATLTQAQVLSELGVGMAKIVAGGAFAIAIAGEDYATIQQLEEIEQQCQQYAEQAATSAEEAATSAGEAATSAGEAAASAAEATGAAGEATAAAGEASASAGAAGISAGAAAASAFAAGISAGSASSSASDASSSASDASHSASSASGSATNAANSATQAQGYLTTLLNTGLTLQGDITGSGLLSTPIVTTFKPNPVFTGNGSMTMPAGNSSQRPTTLIPGMIRFNTSL